MRFQGFEFDLGRCFRINVFRLPTFLGPYANTLVGLGHVVNGMHLFTLHPRPYKYPKRQRDYADKRDSKPGKAGFLALVHAYIVTNKNSPFRGSFC